MKWFLILWFVPIIFLGSWYGLSYHDINFGFIMFSRQVHDLVFQIYGDMLGIPPADIPPLVLKAIILDSFIVVGIACFRWRRKIIAWVKARYAAYAADPEENVYSALPADNEESLSSAP
ncbi:MAG: hypothetical protein GY789_23445 [Hyphomicrobiales bacterium]|nr:hypothetical protein [Hyphomicrobiales bacterium]MCP4998173.1 hypothetical protein [Hyphomicrobiales bacterium]